MREFNEIISDIEKVRDEILLLKRQKNKYMKELETAVKVKFEAEHGISYGDKIATLAGDKYIYKGIKANCGLIQVFCCSILSDGRPSKNYRYLNPEQFGFNVYY